MNNASIGIAAAALLLASGAAVAGEAVPSVTDNPFSQPSKLPYFIPPFDRIRAEDYRPAFDAGMAEQRREIDAINANPEPPSFDNTIVALERSGQMLQRAQTVFFNLTSSDTTDELDKINTEYAPKFSAHSDSIFLDAALFARIQALYGMRDALALDPESRRLLERYHTLFVRAGAPLQESQKARLRKINEELSSLTTEFQQNLLKATNDGAVVVDSEVELDGLPPEKIAAAAATAKARKLEGKWVLSLQNTTGQPALSLLTNRALRERLFRASIARGDGGEHDNTHLIAEIVKLRAERAALLGYPNHAAYVLEDETAGTTTAVNKMLGDLAPAAEANARREAAEMQKVIDAEAKAAGRKSFTLAAWDWAYYAEKVRRARYAFDEAEVKPYFELEHVLKDGLFYEAHELYGLTFKERHDLPVYNPDVRVFEVFNEDGSALGLFLTDYFARDSKQGGAWMNEYVSQSRLTGYKPVAVNNLNVVKPPEGQPVLLSFDEVTTMFHEFGHALHGLFSNVQYPQFAGTSVPRDFVEFPSQYNEMWASDPKVLANFGKHFQTGAAMPKALMDKVLAARKFSQGFITAEYLAAAIVDQSWHQIGAAQAPPASGVMAFEQRALQKAGMDWSALPPRYHSPYFQHVFAGGYSAGYYAYIWSDVLATDTEHWFDTHGGLQRANGDFIRGKLLSRGFSADSITLFREFYGRDPEVAPLLEHRGLVVTSAKNH